MSRQVEYTELMRPKLPSRFVKSSQKQNGRARRAVGYDGNGPASRLVRALVEPSFMTIRPCIDLGMRPWHARAEHIYDHDALRNIVQVLKERTVAPLFYRFEVSGGEHLHLHLVADGAKEFLHIPRDGERVKPIDNLEGLMYYLAKPVVPSSPAALVQHKEASLLCKQQGHKMLPKVQNYLRLRGTN